VRAGIDMFDCVMPTRHARNAHLFTRTACSTSVTRCIRRIPAHRGGLRLLHLPNYSRSYLRHLDKCGEILGSHLNTVHNLHFYQRLMAEIRAAIEPAGSRPMPPSSTPCSCEGTAA
jgi:queuine tRNA-ribosyltransferase